MNKELTPLEVSKQLKDFVLEFVKNGLDRRFIHGSFDIIETEIKKYNQLKIDYEELNDIHNKLVGYKNKERDDTVKKLKALRIIDDCDIDIWLLKHCDYSNYCRVRKLCLEATGNADVDDANREVINLPTEEEFDFLKEFLK